MKTTIMQYRWVFQIILLLLLFVLVYTATSKIVNFTHYSRAMRSQPLNKTMANFLIYSIPIIEMMAVYLILTSHLRQIGLWLTTALMFCFTCYVVFMKVSGWENSTCPCGGLFSELSWNEHLWVNTGLTLLALVTSIANLKINIFPGHGKRGNADATDKTK